MSTPNTSGVNTVILKPGEKVILPRGTVINSVITDGAITVSSTCTLPPVSQFSCYEFYFTINDDADASHPAGVIDIIGFQVNGTQYPISFSAISPGNDPSDYSTYWNTQIDLYNQQVPGSLRLVEFTRVSNFDKRDEYKLLAKIVPELASSTFMLFQATGFQTTPILVQPVETTCP